MLHLHHTTDNGLVAIQSFCKWQFDPFPNDEIWTLPNC